jgi:uncharacterized protein (TIGR02145 family)
LCFTYFYPKYLVMKKLFSFCLVMAMLYIETKAQNVGIGTTNPHSSAELEVSSNQRGFLPPRMTYAERNAIQNPAAGLIIFCSDCDSSGQPQFYNGSRWCNMLGSAANGPITQFVNLPSVTIGTQIWSSKNLDVAHYRNGDPIPQVTDPTQWANLTTGAWCWYNNDSATYASTYGRLYNWYAVNDQRGLAPQGWRIPSEGDWNSLVKFIDSDADTICQDGCIQSSTAGGAMKSMTGWNAPNTGGTNSYGFAGLPGGARISFIPVSMFGNVGGYGSWWSVGVLDSFYPFYRSLDYYTAAFGKASASMTDGLSVRVVRDSVANQSTTIPTITTNSISFITTTTAQSGGNIISDGNSSITARGIIWSTSPNPTVLLTTKTTDGIGIGTFTSSISGLTANTTYYVRAYATNSVGSVYGNEISFNTSVTTPPQPTGQTLDKVLEGNPNDALFLELVKRAGLLSMISDSSKTYTLFVPENNGFKVMINALSQGLVPINAPDAVFAQFINTVITPEMATGIIQYHIVPQEIRAASIPSGFPNFSYPSTLNPAPQISSLLRLNTYLSTRNGAWFNNIPITSVDQNAYNGLLHHLANVDMPPQRSLWDRISTDNELTYLKAAILRADSGVVSSQSLQYYLSNFGAEFTVFAPLDSCFQKTLTGLITQTWINQGVPVNVALQQATLLTATPDVFSNPLLFPALTAQTVKGLVVYHVLEKKAYANNFNTTQENIPTLLNTVVPTHEGLKIQASYTNGVPFPIGVTVKDIYDNSPYANIIMGTLLTPEPVGKSDQNYFNGVLHKIDKVLSPF